VTKRAKFKIKRKESEAKGLLGHIGYRQSRLVRDLPASRLI